MGDKQDILEGALAAGLIDEDDFDRLMGLSEEEVIRTIDRLEDMRAAK
jgi:hypothetical protein